MSSSQKRISHQLLSPAQVKTNNAANQFKTDSLFISTIHEVTDAKEMMACFDKHFLPDDANTNTGRVIKVTHASTQDTGIVVLSKELANSYLTEEKMHTLIYAGLECLARGLNASDTIPDPVEHCDLAVTKQFFVNPKQIFQGMYMHVSREKAHPSSISLSFEYRNRSSHIRSSSLAGPAALYNEAERYVIIDDKYYPRQDITISPSLLAPVSETVKTAINEWQACNMEYAAAYKATIEEFKMNPASLKRALIMNPQFAQDIAPSDVAKIIQTVWTDHRLISDSKEKLTKLIEIASIFLKAKNPHLALKYHLHHWLSMAMSNAQIMRLFFEGITRDVISIPIIGDVLKTAENTDLIDAMLDGLPADQFGKLHTAIGLYIPPDSKEAQATPNRAALQKHAKYKQYLASKNNGAGHQAATASKNSDSKGNAYFSTKADTSTVVGTAAATATEPTPHGHASAYVGLKKSSSKSG